ncbi:DUF1365 domain-containing protein [Novipirellula sp. SH528]|uniref:DUF1365 domain-containing protein n=1 Tax=Novipirellula sp. SH528 TaxID=3454466 RepID=UPI003F9F70FB
MMSCLYRGQILHRRLSPKHEFQYATSWAYLDLTEVETLVHSKWCLSNKRFAPAAYRRVDHFGDPNVSMQESVRRIVQQKTGIEFNGSIRLLTQLRHFGVYFSPINVFYCFGEQGELVCLVAEVSNTPWNERHCYVLWEGNRLANSTSRYSHPKEFHVSPFMGMDSQYQWRVQVPADTLDLSLGCDREGDRIFQANMHLKRFPISDAQLVRSMLRRPVAAVHVVSAIYYQAFQLWMKKCPFYPHPRKSLPKTVDTVTPLDAQPKESELVEQD